MSFDPTPAQKQAIAITSNCVVSAGAGSGKTGVLSERFATLVREGRAHCDQILTLTFTKKATSEMRSRIYSKLVGLGISDELERFQNAYICTVDSLCSTIARSDCRRFGVAADFNVMDPDDFKKKVQNLALTYLCSKTAEPVLDWLFRYKSPQALMEMLPACESDVLDITSQPDPQQTADALLERVQNYLNEATRQLDEACHLYVERFCDDPLLAPNITMLNNYLDGTISRAELVFGRAQGKKDNKEAAKELKEQIKAHVKNCVLFETTLNNKNNILDFYKLVCEFHETVNHFRRSSNILMFQDVMAMTLQILTENAQIRQKWKEKFLYIMIDEFQDNNDDYRKLLYLLSQKKDDHTNAVPAPEDLERGKIFLVGDQKQSIYGFRGADVSVFKKMETEITKSDGCLIELDTNFRSSTTLVDAFNSIFSRVMRDSSNPWQATFKNLKSPQTNNRWSRIMFHVYEAAEEDSKNPDLTDQYQSEAVSLANLIDEMLGGDDWLVDGRRPRPSDIAILLRSATGQDVYEKALRLHNIPYSTKETRALTQEALVNDFYNAIQLCLYPYDGISKAAYGQSPLAAVSLDGLKEILKTGSCAKTVSYIWNNMGYRLFIISNPANQVYEEYYNHLFSLAVMYDANGEGIVGLLDYLRPLLGKRGKMRDTKVLLEQTQGVQIMTIHASKGLEFPIVIVAGMDGGNDNYRLDFKAQINEGLLDLPVVEQQAKDSVRLVCLNDAVNTRQLASKEEAETKRILYVAATRAETHLIFSTSLPKTPKEGTKTTNSKTSEQSMAELLLEACPFDRNTYTFLDPADSFFHVRIYNPVPVSTMWSTGRLTPETKDAVAPWYTAQPDAFDLSKGRIAVTELTHIQADLENTPDAQRLPSINSDELIRTKNLQTVFGTYTHALIEDAVKGTQNAGHFTPQGLAPSQSLSEDEVSMLEHDANLLAQNFITSSLFEAMKTMELHSERKFMFYDETAQQLVEGAIDLYGVNETEVRIVDFKTDLYRIPAVHQGQLNLYTKALQSVYPNKKVSASVVYLRLKG